MDGGSIALSDHKDDGDAHERHSLHLCLDMNSSIWPGEVASLYSSMVQTPYP